MNIPRQKYVLSPDDKCPLCGGEFEKVLYLSLPAKKKCVACGKFVTIY